MATQPMDYSQIINAIRLNALNNPNPPTSGTTEYNTYANLVNTLAIPAWENERGVLWNELWVDEPNFVTISANMTSFPLPDDFKFIGGGFVRLQYPSGTQVNTQILPLPVRKLEEIELDPYNNKKEFYIQGNIVNGFTMLLGWTPQTGDAEIGATLSFRYYKYANTLSATTDIPEMSDPMFIVYKVAAAVARNNFNMNLYQINEDLANYSLKNMRIGNSMNTYFQDGYIKDVDALTGQGDWWQRYQTPFPPGTTVY